MTSAKTTQSNRIKRKSNIKRRTLGDRAQTIAPAAMRKPISRVLLRARAANVIGEAKEKLRRKILAYCAKPRSYAQILAVMQKAAVSDSQVRYLLRQLMFEHLIVRTGRREDTVYTAVAALSRPVSAPAKSQARAK